MWSNNSIPLNGDYNNNDGDDGDDDDDNECLSRTLMATDYTNFIALTKCYTKPFFYIFLLIIREHHIKHPSLTHFPVLPDPPHSCDSPYKKTQV